MTNHEQLKFMVKEAKIYQTQGLFEQSKEKYISALQLITTNEKFCHHERLIGALREEIHAVERDIDEVSRAEWAIELPDEMQQLIKRLFSVSENSDVSEFKGAVALARFGQYDQALDEFNRLMEEGVFPLAAAKNIITCLLAFATPEAAIAQFEKWTFEDLFTKEDLGLIRIFLENRLEEEGIITVLPEYDEMPRITAVLTINLISIQQESGPLKGREIDLDVTFHSGNNLNVIIPGERKDLLDVFRLGRRLHGIQFFSPRAVFQGNAIVFGKTMIRCGPKQGGYVLDLKIVDE